jgi:hypothetical protein
MRIIRNLAALGVCLALAGSAAARGQDRPKLHEFRGFKTKGGLTALVPQLLQERLSLAAIEKAHLDGESTGVEDVLKFMAKFEKLSSKVDEPKVVRGQIPVILPPNTRGDEAYTTCFSAFTYNGLVLAATPGKLELVRPETRPIVPRGERPWNRTDVLTTRLIRLGYLRPDPIMRAYRNQIGTSVGHAIIELNSNDLIVIDRPAAVKTLAQYVDSQILETMGVPSPQRQAVGASPGPPSWGAIASKEAIHFYLMAFARANHVPLVAAEKQGTYNRRYPEADLWTSQQGYRALESEYLRISEFVQVVQQNGGENWVDPYADRVFSPAEQTGLEIRFGVVDPASARADAPKAKTKKAARTVKQRKKGE